MTDEQIAASNEPDLAEYQVKVYRAANGWDWAAISPEGDKLAEEGTHHVSRTREDAYVKALAGIERHLETVELDGNELRRLVREGQAG